MAKRFILILVSTIIINGFMIYESLKAIQSTSATITISVQDSFTNSPVDSVLVRLIQNGSEIASGLTDASGVAQIPFSFTSLTEDLVTIPESFRISESYPNPFQSETNVDIEVDQAQDVTAEVFNVIGQRVASINVKLNPGVYTLRGALSQLAQGMYFLRIRGQEVKTVKMTKIGNSFTTSGAILQIVPSSGSPFRSRANPSASSVADEKDLTVSLSRTPYDIEQRQVSVNSDTTFNFIMSRNNTVIFRVADETDPTIDIERSIRITRDGFEQDLVTPDTLILKSGIYTITGSEGITDAINTEVEIASEDKTVTVFTRLKTLADNQLRIEGTITDESTDAPINRAYVYLLNEMTSDTLAGPLFANAEGVLGQIVNLDNGTDFDLSILYRKDGYKNFENSVSVSLPDTLVLSQTLAAAPAPTAAFTVSGELQAGQPVQFDGSASIGAAGEDLVYSWDFGNGKRGFGRTISHVYTSSINAEVTLTVSGEFGATATAIEVINISSAPNPPSTTIITGEITAVGLEPLEGVTANLVNDDRTSVSGTDGKIVIPDLPSGVPIIMQLTKPGYATQTVRITPDEESEENFFTAAMIPLEQSVTVSAIENGTNISGKFGTRVSLPVDALVDANGELVTGDVDLTMTPLDVSSNEIFAFPGGFEGVRPDGEQGNIISFGVADFTFTQNGETLQMMPGKSAEIEIPVTNPEVEVGDVIPLWTLDEDTGLWIEEGAGEIIISASSPSGLAMLAETGHFSWKNIDAFLDDGIYTLIPKCKDIETENFLTCSIQGRAVNNDGSFSGYAPRFVSPANTNIEVPVPANLTFEMEATAFKYNRGFAEVPPSPANEIKTVEIGLELLQSSETLPIAYGELLKGRATNAEITRYEFEGEQDDFIRIRIREGLGFEGTGDVLLLNSDEEILQQGNYANNFSRYLFEDLPETGTYFIDVVASSDVSNFNISLDLFEPVNRQISYGDRIFDFLWPGTVNTYTFEGETEDVLEIIAQNRPDEGNLAADLTLNTTNPLVSESFSFSDFNVWVTKLEEKDGIYTLEISGQDPSRFGEFIIDVNVLDHFIESGTEIAYGDSAISLIHEIGQISEFSFNGNAGDLIRLHIDKPYLLETSNRLSPQLKLLNPNGSILDEISASFRFNGDAGIGYILPEDGVYTIEVKGNANKLSPEGEIFSVLLREVTNPLTKNLDQGINNAYFSEFFANELDINTYTFSGENDLHGRLALYPNFSSIPDGKVFIFDSNHQLIEGRAFNSGQNRIIQTIDYSLTDQEYTAIVVSRSRSDVKTSTSRETYGIEIIKAEPVEFNTTTNRKFPADSLKYFHIENTDAGNEVSVGAAGSGLTGNVSFLDENQNSISVFNQISNINSQNRIPTVLEDEGNYLLRLFSGSSPADFELTIVDLEPAENFELTENDVVSLNGKIRMSGDIDRFEMTPESDGTLTITLFPAAENGIDDSGNLHIDVLRASDNFVINPDSENDSPEGEELYIWESDDISAQTTYIIQVWDQSAIATGDFTLEVEFTPDP